MEEIDMAFGGEEWGGGLSRRTVGSPRLAEASSCPRLRPRGTEKKQYSLREAQDRKRWYSHQPCQIFVVGGKENVLKGPFSVEILEIVEGFKVCKFKEDFVLQAMLPDCERV